MASGSDSPSSQRSLTMEAFTDEDLDEEDKQPLQDKHCVSYLEETKAPNKHFCRRNSARSGVAQRLWYPLRHCSSPSHSVWSPLSPQKVRKVPRFLPAHLTGYLELSTR
ncbi:hypothetical protein OS493_016542 [Desmophyllum pertusum]|uniref:Uncharacterized protein n=1 Tax=Desmophyllum pertusum TaxID=174260 RepID=A0A9W9ZPE1_9CNID|nr:hypothetical protein OS493_016542 [Desmophyllum pertusum]